MSKVFQEYIKILKAKSKDKFMKFVETIEDEKELLDFMDEHFEYGYITKDGKKVQGLEPERFFEDYSFQEPYESYHSGYGVCWDQVDFQIPFFEKFGYPFWAYYIELEDEPNWPSHSFILFEKDGELYWFEQSTSYPLDNVIYEFSYYKVPVGWKKQFVVFWEVTGSYNQPIFCNHN